jgi:regulator of protease activity HflC (stomatin/prohibitin superfamily)
MLFFILGVIVTLVGIILPLLMSSTTPTLVKWVVRIVGIAIGVAMITFSTAIFVEDGQSGVVVVKFGNDLPQGKIIATRGEKGPQATILPDGWHFGYLPWIYDLQAVDNAVVPQGHVGVVEAQDGLPLPKGEVFAPEWDNPLDMLDGQQFMMKGYKGPQLTVLTPGKWRYNPRLFTITIKRALEVPIGKVAVIKANVGKSPTELEEKSSVNGVSLVPKGYRGIWNTALHPDAYYLHPDAYIVTLVQTTNRMYEYIKPKDKSSKKPDKSIGVKTLDSFEFDVDVRVSAKISAEDAPYVVAMLASPDSDGDGDGFNTLEDIVILPVIRAIFRNNAESKKALEYVQNRTQIEKDATAKFAEGLSPYRVTTDGVFIGENGLTDTQEGKSLMATQTDKEVALQEKATFQEQKLAQEERAKMVKAEEDANQEKNKAIARAKVDIAEQEAQAEIKMAEGRAQAYLKKLEALGGVDNFVKLEMLKMSMEKWQGTVPNILLMGGSGGSEGQSAEAVNALLLKLFQGGLPQPKTSLKSKNSTTQRKVDLNKIYK